MPALLAAGGADAHALVVSSEPAPGAALAAAPATVRVRFNSRIDPLRSRLLLIAGEGVSGAGATPMPLEIAAAVEPTLIEAACPPLNPGPWRLRWQVLAVDGHITRGDIPFTIVPAPAR
ncbi:MAG: copper resistance protein CopC [Acetobacteraceae bacterium]|nr:copper resistance protein CopC [Acetobacteraceae bacterium]